MGTRIHTQVYMCTQHIFLPYSRLCFQISQFMFDSSSLSKYLTIMGFPGGSEDKASACNVGDLGSIPGSGRSAGEGNGNPLQYTCLENPMDRKAW